MIKRCDFCNRMVTCAPYDPELKESDVFGFACTTCRVEEVTSWLEFSFK